MIYHVRMMWCTITKELDEQYEEIEEPADEVYLPISLERKFKARLASKYIENVDALEF